MYRKYYKTFLEANPEVQHYAAHSHHYWPDVTRDATLKYWDDSAKYVDQKWDYFFSNRIPHAQGLIADVLSLSRPEQIVFAPNTHEFVFRLLSCFDDKKSLRILTTDSEFYSFDRQVNRLSENENVVVEKVSTLPFSTFEERFIQQLKSKNYDFIFLSHVFFNSGFVCNIDKIVGSITDPNTVIALDGYHGFMALPTNLASIQNRAFYLAGSYKYAQGGEGCCFMHVPPDCPLRPAFTGWFANFADLTEKFSRIGYSKDGMRFAGSTMDYSGLYRLISVLDLFKKESITVETIHRHIQKLQVNFITHMSDLNHSVINKENLLLIDGRTHGHFYTFELNDTSVTKSIYEYLFRNKIRTDFRGSRLRFGFGLYQEDSIDLSVIKSWIY